MEECTLVFTFCNSINELLYNYVCSDGLYIQDTYNADLIYSSIKCSCLCAIELSSWDHVNTYNLS